MPLSISHAFTVGQTERRVLFISRSMRPVPNTSGARASRPIAPTA